MVEWPVARQNGPQSMPWAEDAARAQWRHGPVRPVAQRSPQRAGTVRPDGPRAEPTRPVVHLYDHSCANVQYIDGTSSLVDVAADLRK
jgi:hypothetical protein